MIKKALFLLYTFFCFGVLVGQEVSIKPVPSWLFKVSEDPSRKPDQKEVSDGYYLQLYDKQTSVAAQTSYTHIIRIIENDNGVQNASEVSVSFAPQYQQVVFHHVNIVRKGKIVSSLQFNQIRVVEEETEAENFLYNGTKRAYIVLRDVRKGDRIDFAYSLTGFNPAYYNTFSDEVYFSKGIEIVNFFATIIASPGQKLKVKTYNDAESPRILSYNGSQTYHWSNPLLKKYESTSGTPSWFTITPYATLTAFNSWAEVGKWAVGLFQEAEKDVSAEIKEMVNAWKREANTDKQVYVAKAVRFVQDEIRYLGFEIGSNTHIPYSPSKVFNQRYGDCKDKALLLAILLRLHDIKAYVGLVNTVSGKVLDQRIPSQLEFNHAIVAIEISPGVYKFIDATTSYQRGRAYEIFTPDYGFALLVKEGVDKLTTIEAGPRKFISIEEQINVSPKGETSKLLVQSSYEGGSADNLRYDLDSYSNRELGENYTKYYSKYYDSVVMEKEIEIQDDSINNTITVREQYNIPSLWKKGSDGRDVFSVFAKPIYDLLPNPEESYKKGPLAIKYPEQIFYKVKLGMPSEWPVDNSPIHIKNNSFQFDFEIYNEADTVFLDYRFISFKDHIPVEEMEKYKEDYKKMIEVMEYQFYQGVKNGNSGVNEGGSQLSWVPFLVLLCCVAGGLLLFRQFNRKSAPTLYHPRIAKSLSGWVVVLGVTLFLGWILNTVSVFSDTFLTEYEWSSLKIAGGIKLQFIVIFQLIFSFGIPVFSSAIIYWYLKRRDIFPRMFIAYVLFLIAGQALILFSFGMVDLGTSFSSIIDVYTKGLIRSVVYGAVWISFIYRSENVKQTFLFPYLYDPLENDTIAAEETNDQSNDNNEEQTDSNEEQ
ncbi:DUF3857 domain-containing protein [Sediminibacterium goheungense]|uniref:Uncharacterized protein DUF2569 n=1 Tax=Sediminibacterium goheungense TaxID=1086393 RepID=A0A4R6J1M3_9BACT|nr:DUF3857 domain-containing protein [Sediminibacterium goheungense]TDO29093.1 uncharacterized protein DUF2569 [Sediminibacterium goheungense]